MCRCRNLHVILTGSVVLIIKIDILFFFLPFENNIIKSVSYEIIGGS